MVTGPAKYRKYIAGLMIMVKMEENLFRKMCLLGMMKLHIKSNY